MAGGHQGAVWPTGPGTLRVGLALPPWDPWDPWDPSPTHRRATRWSSTPGMTPTSSCCGACCGWWLHTA